MGQAGEERVARYLAVREQTMALCEGLEVEDLVVQSMPDASPLKWHLGHTSWYFETFLLLPRVEGYRSPAPQYATLFNSYYEAVGPQWDRPRRGVLSRPTVREVRAYRQRVDEAMEGLLRREDDDELRGLLEVGLEHERQHQELMITDLKHALAGNPLRPVYARTPERPARPAPRPRDFLSFEGGLVEIGYSGEGFAYDNERPRHPTFLQPFELARDLLTNAEVEAFIADAGYARPELWLSDGWATVRERGWEAPLYWEREGEGWAAMTLQGLKAIDPEAPAVHLSHYEADAIARWAGARLPTEQEWEWVAARRDPAGDGAMLEDSGFHPDGHLGGGGEGVRHLFGEVWEWTSSAYLPYPGYRRPPGAIGEYNGKFMSGQIVLRGTSVATPRAQVRPSYRNFFQPDKRWQFSGMRLARDGGNPG